MKCLYCYEIIENLESNGIEFHDGCSKKIFGTAQQMIVPYSFNEITDLAKKVIERNISMPGVQPKLSMSFDKQIKKEKRLTIIGALGGEYIFKPPNKDYIGMPENEHLTMLSAKIFGIPVAKSSLIRLKSGELSYITKRMDRTDKGEKIHMIDLYQLSESYDKYKGTMEKIGKVLDTFSINPLLDKINLFELAVFSFITGNADMHLKNFSMIEKEEGWVLSPGYDLLNTKILTPKDPEEMALLLDGKKSGFSRINFKHFGAVLGMDEKQIENSLKKFQMRHFKLIELIDQSFLNQSQKEIYKSLSLKRLDRLTS